MRKSVKIIWIVVGGLLAVIVLAVALAWIYIDSIATRAIPASIRTVGDVPADVDNVSIAVIRGRVTVEGLFIGNPKGFPEAAMFEVGEATFGVRLKSLFGNPIHVETLELISPAVRLDMSLKGTNIQAFLNNVQRNVGAPPEQPEPEKPQKPSEREAPAEQKRLIIDHLLIRDAQVRLGSGFTKAVPVTLATVELNDIRGSDGQGVTAPQLAALIVVELVKRGAVKFNLNVDDLIPSDLTRQIEAFEEAGRRALESGKDILEQGREASEELERKGREAAEDVRNRLRGIFDGSEDETPSTEPTQ